jgi:alpha/beta superfamily hydrolase
VDSPSNVAQVISFSFGSILCLLVICPCPARQTAAAVL